MDWEIIIKTLGGTTIFVAAAAWLSRSLISQFINKDLEHFKSNLKNENDKEIEKLRNELRTEADKKSFLFTSLHSRRSEIIAELYEHLYDMQGLIEILMFEYRHREIREDIDRKYHRDNREEWKLESGIDTLDTREEERIEKIRQSTNNLFNFYKKHRIYFTKAICLEIDSFLSLTSFMESNYENIALKDTNGNLLVNPIVKETWDKAHNVIPQILHSLEIQFREILGVQ